MRDGSRAFTGNLGTSPSPVRQRAHDGARVTKPGGRPGGDLGLLDRREPRVGAFHPDEAMPPRGGTGIVGE